MQTDSSTTMEIGDGSNWKIEGKGRLVNNDIDTGNPELRNSTTISCDGNASDTTIMQLQM